jgi:hypothetical protein
VIYRIEILENIKNKKYCESLIAKITLKILMVLDFEKYMSL